MAAVPTSTSHWLLISFSLLLASLSATAFIFLFLRGKKLKSDAAKKIQQLDAALKGSVKSCAAERKGRIRAQRALRDMLSSPGYGSSESRLLKAYPMSHIAVIKSCFSTRNGTPRQPLLVPLARASLIFDSSRVPQASLEGLEGYSHCWIIYVFHLNTDLDKLWKHPSQSKFKAKVRVPSLKGERMGVFATRSPHRPCPIGLTVAKVEAVHENTVLLSGVDLVDGTPVLDIKPYLSYCDSLEGSVVPSWVKVDNALAVSSVNFSQDFPSSLMECWPMVEKKSLYSSADEFQCLIKQVLSWDIRSVSQRRRPHIPSVENGRDEDSTQRSCSEDEALENGNLSDDVDVVYHLILESLDVSYRIDSNANVLVDKLTLPSHLPKY